MTEDSARARYASAGRRSDRRANAVTEDSARARYASALRQTVKTSEDQEKEEEEEESLFRG